MGEEVVIDFLNITGMKIIQRNDFFNFSLDSVLLANFVHINRKTKKILELGTGNAAIPMLLSKLTKAKIVGVEIQKISAEIAKRNIIENKLENQIEIIQGDYREEIENLEKHSFDVVISNPPFFSLNSDINFINNDEGKSLARHEINSSLGEMVKSAEYYLKDRGYFSVVHRTNRFLDVVDIMRKNKIEPKRVVFCYTGKEKNSKIVLIEGIKRGKSGLSILPSFYTNSKDGSYTEDVKKMFRGEKVEFM